MPDFETHQSRKSRTILWWMGRLLGGLAGLVVVLALAGAVYQVIATAIDAREYPPPGKLVDVSGYRLHLNCTGQGSPTVVMDAMGPGWSIYWSLVQPEVEKFTPVCSFDRAGLGWSDPGPTPRTAQQIADELHSLLGNAGIAGPYVLVGHSFGGFTVRLYRSRYSTEVVSMVLVDAGHEDQAAGSLDDLPLVVLTATGPVWWPGLPPDFPVEQFRQMWLQVQKDLAKLSSNSVHIFADKSSHFIQFDQPELVVDAIRQGVAMARQRQDTGPSGAW